MKRTFTISLFILFASTSIAFAQYKDDVIKRDAYITVDVESNSKTDALLSDALRTNKSRIGLLTIASPLLTDEFQVFNKRDQFKLSTPARFAGGSPITPNGTPRYRNGLLGSTIGSVFFNKSFPNDGLLVNF